MNEARRFLRFVIPGITFFVELALLLLLADHTRVIEWASGHNPEGIGHALALLVASGGIGAMLSTVHHLLYRLLFYRLLRGSGVDHRDMLAHAERDGHLQLQLRETRETVGARTLSRGGAWRVTTALWIERRSNLVKGAHHSAERLTDIMHGAGATTVGAGAASATVLVLYRGGLTVGLLAMAFVIPLAHLINFVNTVVHANSVIDMVMTEALRVEHGITGEPALVVVSKQELC